MNLASIFLATVMLAAPPASEREVAITRALSVLEQGAVRYPQNRQCFACHHQTLPLLVQTAVRHASPPLDARIDRAAFDLSVRHARDWFAARRERLAAGGRIDGRAITVAYGLWTFELAEHAPDQLTDALVANLLATQRPEGHWEPEAHRPPAEESFAFISALALRGLARYGRPTARDRVERATSKAFEWLRNTSLVSVDDHAGALLMHTWALDPTLTSDERLAERFHRRSRLLSFQLADGGWAQRFPMTSDAYATGLALWALGESGVSSRSPPFQLGARWLLDAQCADGSWHVRSRCEPVQVYFDNGDPHGVDQFLSMMATAWAAAALTRETASAHWP